MDQALLDGGYRCYTGEKIDVYFNTAICSILAIAYVATASYLISNESRVDWPPESPDNQYHLFK